MIGTIVNVSAIALGGLLGTFFRKGIPHGYKRTVMQGLGLCVFVVGLSGALKTSNILVLIICTVLGGILGEILGIERKLDSLGVGLEKRFGKGESTLARGFITGSLIWCVGAMSIIGSLESALAGNHQTLYAKSLIDGVIAIIFGSTMGAGVALSAVVVLIYQGLLTFSASFIKPFITTEIITEMSAIGGLLIMGISLELLEIKKINVANLLPAVFLPLLYAFLEPFIKGIMAMF